MQRVLVTSTCAITLFLSGCESLTKGPQAAGQPGQSQAAAPAGQLIEVWVPGAVRNVYDPPSKQLNPLLNPRTPPPEFREDAGVASNCSPNSLDSPMYSGNPPLVDRDLFVRTMQLGRDVAQARHVWNFNVERLNAQLKVAGGNRSTTRTRPQPQPRTPSRQVAPGGIDHIAFMNAHTVDFEKLQGQLQQNQQVLVAQDEYLKGQTQVYTRTLANLYVDAMARFTRTPPEQVSFASLQSFDVFRARQVELCMNARGPAEPAAVAQIQQEAGRYMPVAQAVVVRSRGQVLQALNRQTSTAAFQQEWSSQFPTPLLQTLASNDPEISRGAAARAQAIQAQEAHARAEAERLVAEEKARQAAALRKKYLENAARNVAPTAQEALALSTTYLIENTLEYAGPGRFGSIDRTGDGSFDDFQTFPIFGRLQTGDTTLSVNGFRCQPKGVRQVCTFQLITQLRARDLILGMLPGRRFDDAKEEEFVWTAGGLTSPTLKKSIGNLYWSQASSGGGSSGDDAANQRARDQLKFEREFDDIKRAKDEQKREDARQARPY